MEPSYRTKLKIGKLFLATWIPRVAHLKGWFIAIKRHYYIQPLIDFSKKVSTNTLCL